MRRETGRGRERDKNAGMKGRKGERRGRERGECEPKVITRARAQIVRRIPRRRRRRKEEEGAHLHPGGSYFPFFREGY